MRYWQHGETGRLLAIDLQMVPSKWVELTKEQYDEMENLQRETLERIKETDVETSSKIDVVSDL